MQTLTEQLATLTDFFTTFDLGNLIAKDANNDYVGFKIRLSAPIAAPIKVDWLLVEEKATP